MTTTSALISPDSAGAAATAPASSSPEPWAGRCSSAREEALRGFAQHGLGLGDHLLELLARRDQRRREMQAGVATVVGPRDQALLQEPAGKEAAQQLLALLGREAPVVVVAHQLQCPEEPGAAHVADDRDPLL